MPAVALLGSRQVGKTTLAKRLKLEKPCRYLDLERPSTIANKVEAISLRDFLEQL
jgi:predicted AAA+ superfamily ATPase